MCAVINAHTAALRSTLFKKINADTISTADDMCGIYAKIAQGIDRCLPDGMLRELGHINALRAVVGKGNGKISFAAAEGSLQLVVLKKTVVMIRCKT